MMYIYQHQGWPNITWDAAELHELLLEVHYLQGRLQGRMEELGFQLREEVGLKTLTQDVLKTSEIEGEKLDAEQVRSSLARRLGMDIGSIAKTDRHVEGIVKLTLDATRHYDLPLTKKRLFEWHTALFPADKNKIQRITVGKWRTKASGPMQVVSGPYGRERVHYEAPSYDRVKKEMDEFMKWLNAAPEINLILQSAVAHFWFVTIHPFDDGNGRIARAIADMILARSEKSPQRFYSMSAQIQRERQAYYEILEKCQKASLNITPWIKWFLECLKRAIIASEEMLETVLIKAQFWRAHAGESFNDRQRLVINCLLDGFYGKLNSSKWAKLTKCSQDTALRDITDLLERKILIKDVSGGRSTVYSLKT